MRLFSILFLITVFTGPSFAQRFAHIADQLPDGEYENIHVKKLDDDPLTTTYLIWVKETVREHHHAEHTEVVYVFEGEGLMTLGEQEQKIGPGDYVFVPKGTLHSVQVLSEEPMKVMSIQTPQFDGSDRIFSDQ